MTTFAESLDELRRICAKMGRETRTGLGRLASHGPGLARRLRGLARRTVSARRTWLLLVELAGVVLVTLGISFWSVPAAFIIGGLVLVSALELRGDSTPKMPVIRPPEDLLRAQARDAAIVINQERFGIGVVDQAYLDKLSISECEKLIQLARAISGVKKT